MLKNFINEIKSYETKAISSREWTYLLTSVLGAVFLAIFLSSIGHLTFEPGRGSFYLRGQADLKPFFDYLPWVMAFFIPAMSMRLWAEERKSGSIEFLLTLPVTTTQAVWGKFWAAWKFMGFALVLTFPMVLTLFFLGSPDIPSIITGYLGAWLLAGQMLAMGLFASSLSKNQVTSFILGSALLTLFMLFDSPVLIDLIDDWLPAYILALIENLGLLRHFGHWIQGVVRVGSLLPMLLSIVFWNWATTVVIDKFKTR
ncbi:MAG: ABC transporter permease subunit [Bacteriovoracaceae bacterium]|nr:ABC transporter permease subunit [Bacteriovoracaceae bacterium]